MEILKTKTYFLLLFVLLLINIKISFFVFVLGNDVQVCLPYPEPLIHFALVCGSRSGPTLRSYSRGNVDKELVESAHDFLSSGGLYFDVQNGVIYASKILRW